MADLGRAALAVSLGLSVYALVAGLAAARNNRRRLAVSARNALFACFGSNIDQFMIQQDGADSNHFVRDNVGVDAVIGQHPDPLPQRWQPSGIAFTMANFVTMRGGEYFFAPSIRFLTGLAVDPT